MYSRRSFIKTTLFSTLAMAMVPKLLKSMPGNPGIGLQLYTVRDAIETDLQGTLKIISEIGYTWLEAAGYSDGLFYGLSPEDFRKIVEELGMELVSSHATFSPDQQQQAIDAHAALGAKYLVYPNLPVPGKETVEDYEKAAIRLNEIGKACTASGIRFGYHNHDFEFVSFGDRQGYDILLGKTDPGLVFFQADLYWMIYAGIEPADYFDRYPGRFEQWHVKDMEDTSERSYTEVGTGVIDYSQIFRLKEKSGMKYFFVEQDTCKRDPKESIAISYNNLLSIIP